MLRGQGSPVPLLATSMAQARVLPPSTGIVPRDMRIGPPLPWVLAAPAAPMWMSPLRAMVMLPIGAKSVVKYSQRVSFSIVVCDAVWCQATPQGRPAANPPDERARVCHPLTSMTVSPAALSQSAASTK